MAYIFAALNSLQGFFIFLFHCVQNEKVIVVHFPLVIVTVQPNFMVDDFYDVFFLFRFERNIASLSGVIPGYRSV